MPLAAPSGPLWTADEKEPHPQDIGAREDAYARPTDRYGTFRGALDCLFTDANFSVPSKAQGDLFDPVGEV